MQSESRFERSAAATCTRYTMCMCTLPCVMQSYMVTHLRVCVDSKLLCRSTDFANHAHAVTYITLYILCAVCLTTCMQETSVTLLIVLHLSMVS